MNYKLAKQLKDAGFNGKYPIVLGDKNNPDVEHYYPTLSELIEACGKFKFELIRAQAGWCAKTKGIIITSQRTPEEAVAKLWLKLNKK